MKRKKTNTKLFTIAFMVVITIMIVNNILQKDVTTLIVPNNPGVSGMNTIDDMLVCIFQNGNVVTWEWESYKQLGQFNADTAFGVILDTNNIAAINSTGGKVLNIYSLPDGQLLKDLSVGWEDQDVWLRVSPNRKNVVLVRRNPSDSNGNVLYQFLTIDIQKELLGPPMTMMLSDESEVIVDYAIDNTGKLMTVGSRNNNGYIVTFDLNKGIILWEKEYPDAREFCSTMINPSEAKLYAGNRDGVLYKLSIETGDIEKRVILLEDGETRSITNDYSVLNLSCSPDGNYYVATINPKAYILKSDTDKVIYKFSPADRLVSKIAFSPDNKYVATSDIRAGYPVKVWPLPRGK